MSEYKRFIVDERPYETSLTRTLEKCAEKPRPASPAAESLPAEPAARETKNSGDQRRRVVPWYLWR